MVRPHRRVVRDPLRVVPHAVLVHECRTRVGGDTDHEPVGRVGDAGQHAGGEPARRLRPARAHELVVRADAAGGHDDGARRDLHLPDDGARRRRPAFGVRRCEHLRAHARHRAVGHDERGDPVPEPHVEQARGARVQGGADERLEDARAGAPRDVEAGHGVPVRAPGGPVGARAHRVPATLRPLHEREPPHALVVQPAAHLAGGEVHEPLRPRVAVPVGALAAVRAGRELRGPEPVVERELGGVRDAHAPLLGRADEEEPAERPPCLPAQARRGLLVEQDHPAARRRELGRRDETGEPGPTTTTSGSSIVGELGRSRPRCHSCGKSRARVQTPAGASAHGSTSHHRGSTSRDHASTSRDHGPSCVTTALPPGTWALPRVTRALPRGAGRLPRRGGETYTRRLSASSPTTSPGRAALSPAARSGSSGAPSPSPTRAPSARARRPTRPADPGGSRRPGRARR